MSFADPVLTIRDRESALQACVTRRKRKLAELYNVTLAVGSHPRKLPGEPPEGAQSPALTRFLDQNDLELGRTFDESTIPITPRFDWSFDQSNDAPLIASFTSRVDSPNITHADGRQQPASTATPIARSNASFSAEGPGKVASKQDWEARENGTAIAIFQTEPDVDRGALRVDAPSGKTNVAERRARLPPDKATSPHSPPYSPHHDPHTRPKVDVLDAAGPGANDEYLRLPEAQLQTTPVSVDRNLLASRRQPHPSSRGASPRRASSRPSTRIYRNRPPSPSSTTDPRSSDTSRAGGRSSTTSPDEEVKQVPERVSMNLNDERAIPEHEQAPGQKAADVRCESPVKRPENVEQPQAHRDQGRDTKGSKDVAVQTSGARIRPTASRMVSVPPLPRNSPKRRRTGKSTYTAVMSKTKHSGKYAAMVRSLQSYGGADNRVPSSRKDYMHLLFLRQALDSTTAFRADLATLLNSSNKTLSTTDWQTSLREKQDCTIIKRIYDLQQSNRWSLRQMKLSIEPSEPTSHQDALMKEMKWLQTDFREERKLKLCQSQQIAHLCHDWCHADTSRRASLQVRPDLAITSFALENEEQRPTSSLPAYEIPTTSDEDMDADPTTGLFATNQAQDSWWLLQSSLDQGIVSRLPLYDPGKQKQSTSTLRDPSLLHEGLRSLSMPPSTAHATADDRANEDDEDEDLPPEDTSCALFQSEWKPLRARVNVQWAFKPPPGQMPSPGFYENRRPSQWTPDDELQLRQFAKDFPSNWNLISERLTPRSSFVSSSSRRTPWECYERLISMEGASTDPGTRQYAKQFQSQMDKIRMRWSHIVQQQLQAAQNAGQQAQVPRFPVPARVERKSASKRFPALVDAARKVARKRESSEANRKQTHHEGSTQGQMPIRGKPEALYTPQQWSNVKYKQQLAINAKQEQARQQHIARMATQRGSYPGHGNNQPLYSSGIAQRMGSHARNVDQSAAAQANGHLAVPMSNASRPFQQQQGSLANGVQPGGQLAQIGIGNRSQAPLQGQERATPHYNGSAQISEHNIQQLMQQAQQQSRSTPQYPVQRPSSQNQFNRSSSSLAHSNGVPNLNMIGHLNGDSAQSPRPATSAMHGSNHGSPDVSHAMPVPHYTNAVPPSQPQSLSTGQVPAVVHLQHQIMQQHPGMTPDEVQRMTNQELKSMLETNRSTNSYDRSRQNAINAATGMHSNLQQQQQAQSQQAQSQQQQQRLQGPQSPYLHHPQPASGTAQQQQQQQGSPYTANGLLQHPQNAAAVQHNKSYAQQMRQSTTQQMRHVQNNMASPSLGNVSMRPPSSVGTAGEQQRPGTGNSAQQQMQQQQQMGAPGTPRLASQSPRPVSAQGLP